MTSKLHRAPIHGLHFGQFHRVGMRPRRQHLPRPQVIGHQDIARDGSRPVGFRKNVWVGDDGDIGIHQRRPAQARALDDGNVLIINEFIESERIQITARGGKGGGGLVRKSSGGPFTTAFQKAD